jgi:hypothetical protein
MMKRVLMTAAALLAAVPVSATIVSGKLTVTPVTAALQAAELTASVGEFLKVDPVPAGLQVGWDNFQDPHVRGFDELQNVMLDRRLQVSAKLYLPAGTRVSSHYIVFDAPLRMSASGTVDFADPVLAVIWQSTLLQRSDFLGQPGITYQQPISRGIERATDSVSFAGRSVDFRFLTDSPGDSIRVITAASAVPEPGTWALLVTGFGLVGHSLRRARRRQAYLAG